MRLQILVPQYHEDEKVIKNLLDSISIQRVDNFDDFEVIIVSDGGDVILSEDFLNKYPYNIKYIVAEHKGVSAARNRALDEATADYVMFCDADDCFFTCVGLTQILDNLNKEYDVMQSNFIQEKKRPGLPTIYFKATPENNTATFIHGKVYRRQFLIDNDIRWDDELTCHEDGYFNGLALNLVKKEKLENCDDPFYMWCDNSASITRRDPYFFIKTYVDMIKAQDHLIQKFLDKKMEDKAAFMAARRIYGAFFVCVGTLRDNWELEEYFIDIIKVIKEFYKKYKDLWNGLSYDQKDEHYNAEKKFAKQLGYYRNLVGFDNWFKAVFNN